MAITKNDELNNLRSIPFDKYFGDMIISPADKRKRIRLAKKFESFFIDMLYLLATLTSNDLYDLGFVEAEYYQKILGLFDEPLDLSQREHLRKLVKDVAEVTLKHTEEPYYTSNDRARFIAENEANTICNYEEYKEAIILGKTQKTWITMLDNRVRLSHEFVENETLPIDEPFIVGTSQMMFPKDTSLGASAEEIVNCRCSIIYE